MRYLEELKTVLQEVQAQEKPWNMSKWLNVFQFHKGPIPCGTASCALGWFARHPIGQALGVSINMENHVPQHHGQYSSGEEIFQITESEAAFLFLPITYAEPADQITPQDVIDRVDWLLAGKSPNEIYNVISYP